MQPDNTLPNVPEKAIEQQPSNIEQIKTPEVAQSTPEGDDPNWKSFREARKRDIAAREAAEKIAREKEAEAAALKAAMEAAFTKMQPQQSQQNYYNEQPEESEDERIDKKVAAALAAREAEYRNQSAQREAAELPQRLNRAYPDYNQVVSEENGAYLEYHHPELYRALLRQPENFETCTDIYNAENWARMQRILKGVS